MANYIHGAVKDYSQTKGWITGAFMPEGTVNHDKNLEIKIDYFNESHSFKKHHHSTRKTWTIVLQGAMHMIIADKPLTINAGEFIIYEPGVTEELLSTDPNTIAVSIHSPSLTQSDKVDSE